MKHPIGKPRYLATPHAPGDDNNSQKWAAICQTPLYREAIEVALVQLVLDLNSGTAIDAANNGMKLEGAKAFVRVLSELGETGTRAPAVPRTPQLEPT